MLRSILIGLDGSDYSRAAVDLGIRWAHRFDATLVGLGIVDEPTICKPQPVPIGGSSFKRERDQALLDDAQRRVDRWLRQFARSCAAHQVRCELLEDVGPPPARIVEQSKLHDLVMLGTQTFFRFETQDYCDDTLGHVLRQSGRPIVTVPNKLVERGRVLVAYDGSPGADRALMAFQALGLAKATEIHVISIDSDAGKAARRAEQGAKFLRTHDVAAVPHARTPAHSVAATIMGEAQRLQSGLLVMGACGQARWRKLFFGSTTLAVIEDSPIPIFLSH